MLIKKLMALSILTIACSSPAMAVDPLHYFSQKIANQLTNIKPTAKTIGNGGVETNCQQNYPLGKPVVVKADKDKVERRSFYLCRSAYAVQFDPAYKTALWSAENLTADRMNGVKEPRANDFQTDPQVPNPAQASLNDYKGSGFDRGHMSPAADMKIYNPSLNESQLSQANTQAMSESFYLTNMVPQVGPNQNRGIWADLEGQVRNWATKRGQILVVTGPIYENGYQVMGRSKVGIPTKLYKVIIDTKTYETIAFIIPNRQIITRKTKKLDTGNIEYPQTTEAQAINCGQSCSIANFVFPVIEVEKQTGLRFFSALSNQDHDKVVNTVSNSWQLK